MANRVESTVIEASSGSNSGIVLKKESSTSGLSCEYDQLFQQPINENPVTTSGKGETHSGHSADNNAGGPDVNTTTKQETDTTKSPEQEAQTWRTQVLELVGVMRELHKTQLEIHQLGKRLFEALKDDASPSERPSRGKQPRNEEQFVPACSAGVNSEPSTAN
jgi:hypothetical protein